LNNGNDPRTLTPSSRNFIVIAARLLIAAGVAYGALIFLVWLFQELGGAAAVEIALAALIAGTVGVLIYRGLAARKSFSSS